MNRYVLQRQIKGVLLYLLAAVGTFFFLGPFVWSALASFKGPTEIYLFPPTFFPEKLLWSNYTHVFEVIPFARFYWNTTVITVLAITGTLIGSTLVAYGFARFDFPGRDIIFMLVIATMIIPEQVILVPRFLLYRVFGWLDSFLPLIVPSFFGVPFFIFLLRQFILGIPRELDEAAEIDGASGLRILWSIIIPNLKPALASVAVLSFILNWNSFIEPLIYLRSRENFTLALGLRFFQQGSESASVPQEPFLMAATLMMTIPPILIFFFAQRYFVRGVAVSGIKG